MQPIMHFTLSLVVGAMLARGQKHPVIFAMAFGVIGILPDVDHFLTSPAMPDSWMHSGYFLVVAPMLLFVAAFVFDHARPERGANAQAPALAVLVILSGHMALDIAASNALPVAYPVETGTFETAHAVILYAGNEPFLTVSDVPLACWATFCMMAFAFGVWTSSAAPAPEEDAEAGYSFLDSFFSMSHLHPV